MASGFGNEFRRDEGLISAGRLGAAQQGLTAAHFVDGDFCYNVRSTTEVDAVMAQAEHAGAVMIKPAQETFRGGYAGYFQDQSKS